MVVVGDEMQGIYGFKEADSRYLTMAEHIFSSKMGMLIAVSTIYYSSFFFFFKGSNCIGALLIFKNFH